MIDHRTVAAKSGIGSLHFPDRPILRAYDWLRGAPAGLFALAVAIGAGAGLGAIAFRLLILEFTRIFTGTADYSAVGPASHPWLPQLGPWFVVVAAVVGGLIYGPLIERFASEARGHGVPEVMLAVAERGGRIRPRVAVVKALASALCIGSGGSVGREGPIVQIGSALGSTLGQVVRVSESRLRLLVACGAAGGISATFNAPIAGVFFGLELILRDFEVESFGAVVVASVVADIIGRAAFGTHPFLVLPAFKLSSPWEYLIYAGLGALAAVVGVAFIRVLYGTEDLCDRLWRGPGWLRPGVGGLVLGLLLVVLPQMYGVGYPVLERAIRGEYMLGFLALLLVGKMVATSLTIGIGGSGGVFAPSLFMGAMLGTAYGDLMHQVLPGIAGPAGAYGLIGMGAVFAGAAQAPITAIIMIFELTGDYQIILPLMFAVVLATGVSRVLTNESIYTLKLRRRGIDIRRGRAANLMEVLTVGSAMRPVPAALPEQMALGEVIARFTNDSWDALPVVDAAGAFRGTVTFRQVEQAMRDNALDAVAGELAQDTPTLTPVQTLEQALQLTLRHGDDGLPVLDRDSRRLIGWLTHRDILSAYYARLERTISEAKRKGTPIKAQDLEAARAPAGDLSASLRDYRIVDLELRGGEVLAGRRIADVPWPPSSLVLAVRRGGSSFVPDGQTELRRGDRLSILVPVSQAKDVDALIGTLAESTGRVGDRCAETSRRDPAAVDQWPPTATAGTVVLEPVIAPGSRVAGRMLRDVNLGAGVLIMAIHRGRTIIVPRGDSYLVAGDRVTILARSDHAREVLERLR
ncbi:MAG TPA: chloride channel protein [bacterium]|nr:chloride channel protein [bacterium]